MQGWERGRHHCETPSSSKSGFCRFYNFFSTGGAGLRLEGGAPEGALPWVPVTVRLPPCAPECDCVSISPSAGCEYDSVFLSVSLSQDVYVNVSRIMSLGNRLMELGHTSAQQIQQLSGQLEQEWRAFAAALDERSCLLESSAAFHHRAEQVRWTPAHTHIP